MWSYRDTAAELLNQVAADTWGQVTQSVYETSRLVALAPWLTGHSARVRTLRRWQRQDGGWGGPEGYAIVPTLSATAALAAESHREHPAGSRDELKLTVAAGAAALRHWLTPGTGLAVPDTIGVELIIPALLDELNGLTEGPPLPMPAGFDHRRLDAARARLATGRLPRRAWACLEIFGAGAAAASFVRPAAGAVGCSAAATAAWLGGPAGDPSGTAFLESLQARDGGPVPGVTPITYFEPAWVLNNLAIAGFDLPAPGALLDRLAAGLGETGAPAAPGLPADADDTAAVLTALMRFGRVHSPDCLLPYRSGDHFTCFTDERNPSVSTNAHVLEAFAAYRDARPQDWSRFAAPAAVALDWLLQQQEPDGCWWDKWHASPYYATVCCVLALVSHGGAASATAVRAAVRWVLDTQRADGSWGRWRGTVEETAYAVQILALATRDDRALVAARRGCAFLADESVPVADQPLWHAKDLYSPTAVIRSARLSALRLGSALNGHGPLTRQRVRTVPDATVPFSDAGAGSSGAAPAAAGSLSPGAATSVGRPAPAGTS